MIDTYRIDEHPLWTDTILPLLFTNGEQPDRGRGGSGRIELREPGSVRVRQMLVEIKIRCVRCSAWIHPIRERSGSEPSSLYFTPSCEQRTNAGCSRSADAHNETERLIALIHGWTDPRQPSLFTSEA